MIAQAYAFGIISFLAEHNSALLPAFPEHYRKMRTTLTLVASAAMLTLHLAG